MKFQKFRGPKLYKEEARGYKLKLALDILKFMIKRKQKVLNVFKGRKFCRRGLYEKKNGNSDIDVSVEFYEYILDKTLKFLKRFLQAYLKHEKILYMSVNI